jgi:hypothetical protein
MQPARLPDLLICLSLEARLSRDEQHLAGRCDFQAGEIGGSILEQH